MHGDAKVLKEAITGVLFLAQINDATRAALLQRFEAELKGTPMNSKVEIVLDRSHERDTMELFLAVVKKSVADGNAFFQEVFILWFMLYDSFFGRWMLHGEDPQKSILFMTVVQQLYHYHTNGWKLDGTTFKAGDNTNGRCGEFLKRVQTMFIRQCC